MKKIKNFYCWNTIKDWMDANQQGYTEICGFPSGNDKESLTNLVELAINNCFPLQIVCIIRGENKTAMLDPLMQKFLCFVSNEVPVVDKDRGEIYFKDLPKEKQDKILETEINSVWMRLEQNERLRI